MQKQVLVLGSVALALGMMLVGCPGDPDNGGQDAGLDANDGVIEEPIIQVSGTASVYPNAAAWMTGAGQTVPAVEGLTLRVEEPLGAVLNDPNAVFGTVVLPADGTFTVNEVDTSRVNLGIAAGIRDERDGGTPTVVRSATGIFDVQIAEGKPTTDIAGAKAYALPVAYHDKLTEAVTATRIQDLNPSYAGTDTLIEPGFILGKVVDASGNPVAGAVIETTPASWGQNNIFYPDTGLTTVTQAGTAADGLFIFVNSLDPNNAASPTTFTFVVSGKPEYLRRNAGASKDTSLILNVFPGRTAP